MNGINKNKRIQCIPERNPEPVRHQGKRCNQHTEEYPVMVHIEKTVRIFCKEVGTVPGIEEYAFKDQVIVDGIIASEIFGNSRNNRYNKINPKYVFGVQQYFKNFIFQNGNGNRVENGRS